MRVPKNDLLEHLRWLRRAVHLAEAEVIIPGDSLAALLRKGDWHGRLLPRFLTPVNGTRLFTAQLHDETVGFAGWLPYPARHWSFAADRVQFREVAARAGLPVLDQAFEASAETRDVVVKRASVSAEHPVSMPIRQATERPLDREAGEYYEPFVLGDRLEVWYWNGVPVCGEMQRPPFVIGDGASALSDLILHRASFSGPRTKEAGEALLGRAEAFLRYRGLELSTVLERGVAQVVDFRRHSGLEHPSDIAALDLAVATDTDWFALLRRIGQAVKAAAPEETRDQTLFSVDAVVDGQSRLWLLGLNSNPIVHPLAYPAIIRDLTDGVASGRTEARADAGGPAPARA